MPSATEASGKAAFATSLAGHGAGATRFGGRGAAFAPACGWYGETRGALVDASDETLEPAAEAP